MAAVTRLGLYGGSRSPYGSFAGKAEAPPVVEEAATGGGKSGNRKKRYPRRILLGERLVWVKSAEEERRVLAEYIASLEAKAAELESKGAPPKVVAKAKIAVVRAERRLESVDDRETQWLARLRDEDEEILLLLH